MINNFKDKIFTNSSMLPTLLKNLNNEDLGWCNNVIDDENIKNFLSDDELVRTVEIFLKNNLNISKTSTNGFMHRNTLLYRIEKIKKITGLDVREFEDAVTIYTILILNKQKTISKKRK